jgi:hypothetical protein
MKLLTIVLILFSINSFATEYNYTICDSLYQNAIYNCKVEMCKDLLTRNKVPVTSNTIEKCVDAGRGDLLEGAQICAIDGGEFDRLIKKYNKENPAKKISCDDY